MLYVVSKKVLAQSYTGRLSLDDELFRNIEERFLGKNPRYNRKDNDGDGVLNKITVHSPSISTPGRAAAPGSNIESVYQHTSEDEANNEVGSDYNDGRRARDNAPYGDKIETDENINPYFATFAFNSESDHTNDNNLLNPDSLDKKKIEQENLDRVQQLEPVFVSKRYPVDH